ncbi:PAS domain S-box protein [Methyloglobulus sp.]|uniref:sensor domain-containing protein n=1 Tax=Methyloglobulus sp. TaxID=2518622 RepID=UPI003989C286
MSIWTIWHPDYWLEGLIKFATALVSLVTALLIWPLIPKLLQLPSPQALKTSETYLRAIFNATPDAMLISNDQGIISMANQQAEILLGYKADELIGESIEVLLPERFRVGHPALRAQFLETPFTRMRGMGLKKDNSEFDVDISLSPIQTEQGLFIASALRDVTLQKQAEVALQASEERFRKIANNSSIIIWITDENGNSTFVNQSWQDLTGIESTQMAYKAWIKTVHPDDRDTAFVGYYQNTQRKDPITSEYRIRGVDGAWHWILDKAIPLYNGGGKFTGYIGSAMDITERKQAEIQLRVAATAFETQEAMVITDANCVILQVNRAFTESTGYTADETVGRHIDLLKSGQHDEVFNSVMWESVEHTGSWQGEIWGRRKDGEIYPNWLVITAAKGHDGVVSHYVYTHIDITERKLAEEKIKKLAFYDPLTQLPNRRLLIERLNYGIAIARREGRQLALLMLDLDRFKAVNDSFGHQAGDQLLQQVAERLKARLRAGDTIARWGGDEFIVLLENIAHPDDAARIAKEIIADLTKSFQLIQSDDVQIGASIGISLYPQHADNSELLLDYADAALPIFRRISPVPFASALCWKDGCVERLSNRNCACSTNRK